jgi:hypothetical protein
MEGIQGSVADLIDRGDGLADNLVEEHRHVHAHQGPGRGRHVETGASLPICSRRDHCSGPVDHRRQERPPRLGGIVVEPRRVGQCAEHGTVPVIQLARLA